MHFAEKRRWSELRNELRWEVESDSITVVHLGEQLGRYRHTIRVV